MAAGRRRAALRARAPGSRLSAHVHVAAGRGRFRRLLLGRPARAGQRPRGQYLRRRDRPRGGAAAGENRAGAGRPSSAGRGSEDELSARARSRSRRAALPFGFGGSSGIGADQGGRAGGRGQAVEPARQSRPGGAGVARGHRAAGAATTAGAARRCAPPAPPPGVPSARADQAAAFERAGFQAILDRRLEDAIAAFESAREVWPDIHVAEIADYLAQVEPPQISSTAVWAAIDRTILTRYSWGMPAQPPDSFRARVTTSR